AGSVPSMSTATVPSGMEPLRLRSIKVAGVLPFGAAAAAFEACGGVAAQAASTNGINEVSGVFIPRSELPDGLTRGILISAHGLSERCDARHVWCDSSPLASDDIKPTRNNSDRVR